MSFVTYASQFLNRPQASSSANPSSSSTSQPLFFSFTTDEASVHLDDSDDPHFHKYNASAGEEDEEDPYLRLDEEEGPAEYARSQYPDIDSDGEGEGVGWLAHQRSPSPSYTLSPAQPTRVISPNSRPHSSHSNYSNPIPQAQSLSLALSDPAFHSGRSGRRKPQPNAHAAAAFLGIYSILCVLSLLSLVLPGGNSPSERPPPALLHTIPLLTFLTILSALLSYTHLALLRAFLRPVLLVSALAPPLALFLSSILAFAGSFSSGAGWGLRLFALIPLALALLSVRRLPAELHRAARSPAVLSLSTRILFFRVPLLLLLSPLILLAGLILSLPLLTLLVRLPLSHSWYMQLGSAAVAVYTVHVYFVARAIQRSVVAGGVGAWYFSYSIPPPPPSDTAPGWNTGSPALDAQVRIVNAALRRPPGPFILAALVALLLSTLSLLQLILLYLPLALPYRFIALFADLALAKIQALGERVGGGRYTGVYCGLTGAGFWEGVKGVRDVRASAAERAPPALPLPRPYTLALPFALVAYLRAAGDREGEEGISYADQQRAAIAAAVLAGAVCAAVGVFCAGVVRDCADTLYVCHLIDRAAGKRPGSDGRDGEGERQEVWGAFDPSPADLVSPPHDAETGFGNFNLGGFNLGGFGFGMGGGAGEREGGGRGEEPVYARLRRTSEEENRKAPLPAAPRGRERGFQAPGPGRGVSAVRDYSPPPRMGASVSRNLSAALETPQPHVAPPQPPAHVVQPQPLLQSQQRPQVEDVDSDVDSLDSRSQGRGGESSGAFPGSGFF
ncbi:hypothetical protein C8R43DRAFT_1233168 [Mycena crocata]|nr:hypothetical protein C8R43DRAFT_1233168 [Mycena crocata]